MSAVTKRYYTDAAPFGANVTIFFAMQIARKYVHRTPDWKELAATYDMSRPTAYRWLRAIKDAKGEA